MSALDSARTDRVFNTIFSKLSFTRISARTYTKGVGFECPVFNEHWVILRDESRLRASLSNYCRFINLILAWTRWGMLLARAISISNKCIRWSWSCHFQSSFNLIATYTRTCTFLVNHSSFLNCIFRSFVHNEFLLNFVSARALRWPFIMNTHNSWLMFTLNILTLSHL